MRNLSVTFRQFSDEEKQLARKLGADPGHKIEFRAGLALKGLAGIGALSTIVLLFADYADGEFDNPKRFLLGTAGSAVVSLAGSYLMAGPLEETAQAVDNYKQRR